MQQDSTELSLASLMREGFSIATSYQICKKKKKGERMEVWSLVRYPTLTDCFIPTYKEQQLHLHIALVALSINITVTMHLLAVTSTNYQKKERMEVWLLVRYATLTLFHSNPLSRRVTIR